MFKWMNKMPGIRNDAVSIKESMTENYNLITGSPFYSNTAAVYGGNECGKLLVYFSPFKRLMMLLEYIFFRT